MKKIYFFLCLLFCSAGVFGQLFWNTNGVGNTLTATNWGVVAAGPFTTAWTNGSNINFTANSTITNVTTIPIGNFTVINGSTVAWTGAGTYSTGNGVRTFDIDAGSVLTWIAQNVSTGAGTGFIKNGAGTWNMGAQSNNFPGGFTLNAGTITIGGIAAMGGGGGALNLNGGTLATAANRNITSRYSAINIGGNFTFGNATNAANITFADIVTLGSSVNRTITLGATGTYTFSGAISGVSSSITLNNTAAGTLVLGGVNTYSGGTTINGGVLACGAVNTIPAAGTMTLGGGTLRTSTAGAGFTQSTETLNLTNNSTIALGTGPHTLSFANSSAELWTAAQMITITGWEGGYNGTSGTAGQIFVGTDATGLTVGQLAQVQFFNGTSYFTASILPTGEVVPGVAGGVPDIALSSPNPAVAIGNILQGTNNNPIYRFDLAVTTAVATLNGVTITTAGTYAATDIANLRCWYSSDATFNSATDVLLSTLAAPAVAGTQVFPSFTNQVIADGTTGYIFITVNVPCAAVAGNDISVNAITTGDISFAAGNVTGSAFAGGLQTITLATPNNVTVPAASVANASSSLSWVNPAGCYDAVLIVARALIANDGIPSGDGIAYTGNLAFPTGTALGSGFVVYNGPSASPQVVTGLTNGTLYFYKFFTRKGTNWTAGVEVSATPAAVTSASDYFRSVAPGGNWGSVSTWESSPDNATWIPATLVPTATANTITIQNTADVTVAAGAGGDQIIVEAGATLTLAANFTLADDISGTDLIVNGTVINSGGTHTFTGTTQFNANTLYQHNRNGSQVIPAIWDLTSTAAIIGTTASQPTGLGQTFGNFTWNCPLQSQNIGLGSPAGFSIAGNLTVTNTGGVTNRAFRFTSNTAYTLSVGGNLIMNGGHLGLTSGTGTMALTVAGDVIISNNSELYLSQGGSANGTLNIAGNLSVNTGTITETGSSNGHLVVFNKTGTQTFSATAATLSNDINYTINAASILVLNNDLPLNAGRTVLVDGTLDASTLQITGAGDITVNGTLRTAHADGLEITGTLANSGTKALGVASTVDYYAAGAQIFSSRADYANVIIDGGGDKTLNGTATLSANLTLTNGFVVSTAANLITLTNTATVSGASNTSYVDGPVKKAGNTAFTFPVGKIGIGYVPIGVSSFIGTLDPVNDAFTAEYIRGDANSLGPILPTALVDHLSHCDYWVLDRSGLQIANVTASWDNTINTCGAGPYVTDLATLELAHFNSAIPGWDLSSNGLSFTTGTAAAGTITWSAVNTFSPFSLASVDNATNPLPIIINYFNGAKQNGNHFLNWKVTCTNTPSVTMELERSTDGRNYNPVYSVTATALQCQQPFNYTDNQPKAGINYYRLKMTDANGKITYSSIVSLLNATKGFDIMNIAPNPIVNGNFKLNVSAAQKTQMHIVVTDMQGRMMQKQTVNMIAGFNVIPMNVANLTAGTYQVYGITADGISRVLRFVIQ